MSKRPAYPFVPKSKAYLEPGHFWSIPLRDGGYGCGRVLQLWMESGKCNRRLFLAGLMNWVGDDPPTAEAIAGRGVLDQGIVHIKTIAENAGEVLGLREPAPDGIEPWLFLDAGRATCVQRGFNRLRPFDPRRDVGLPVLCTWGFAVIKILADEHLGSRQRSVRRG
jgi:hypothetical protein